MSAPRVAFLGPAGTFSDDALRTATAGAELEAVPAPTIYDAIAMVQAGETERALVPFENSIEGSVRPTLDALAFETEDVAIVGEYDHPIRTSLIARTEIELGTIEEIVSHPQPLAQCARFLRANVPAATVRATASTTEAIREVGESERRMAALGAASAARLYDCVVLREGIQDEADNVTRFVWIAPVGTKPRGGGAWRTTLTFSELGADHPGALVEALEEFSSRAVNLTRIESRPLRRGLGRYMFFIDLEGESDDPAVAGSIEAIRGKAENVQLLGSYPVLTRGIP
jgi:prephenate dehydratase